MHHSTLSSTHGLHARDARGGPPLSRDEWKVSKTFPNVPKGAEPFPVGNHWPNYFWSPPLESQRAGMESATWPTSVSQDLRQGGSRANHSGRSERPGRTGSGGEGLRSPQGPTTTGQDKDGECSREPTIGGRRRTREKAGSERRQESRDSCVREAEGGERPGGADNGAQSRGAGRASREQTDEGGE